MASQPPIPRPVRDPDRLEELIKEVVPGGSVVTIDVDAPEWAQPMECVVNVQRMIDESGGEAAHGWSLRESLPDVLMEAEYHSLWKAPDGSLRDLTPKELPFFDPRTVFLSDPSLTYEGRQIDNIRVPLVDDQLIRTYIKIQERKFAALNDGELADYHGPVAVTPRLERLFDQERRFLSRIHSRYF